MNQQTNLRARILAILSSVGPQTVSELVRILDASDPQPIHACIGKLLDAHAVGIGPNGQLYTTFAQKVRDGERFGYVPMNTQWFIYKSREDAYK